MMLTQNAKVKSQNLRFIFLILILYLLSSIFYPQPIRALESTLTSTPSADPLRQSDSEASLKSKLKILQDDIASKAAKLKEEISKKLQNKAYVGAIKSKSVNTLIVATISGDKTIVVNDYTEYVGKKVSLKNLVANDNIAALGDVDDKEVLTAKKIIKLDTTIVEKKVITGHVVSASNKTLNLQTKDNQKITITVDKDTVYQAGKNEADFSNIKPNANIATISTVLKTTLTARFVYLIPNGGFNLKLQPASPSATIKPTKTIK